MNTQAPLRLLLLILKSPSVDLEYIRICDAVNLCFMYTASWLARHSVLLAMLSKRQVFCGAAVLSIPILWFSFLFVSLSMSAERKDCENLPKCRCFV